jgi:metal-sulfur cluster biosynthetic enzyme
MTAITEGRPRRPARRQEPELGRDIVTLDMVKSIAVDGHRGVRDRADDAGLPLKDEIEGNARSVLAGIGVERVKSRGAMVRRANRARRSSSSPA